VRVTVSAIRLRGLTTLGRLARICIRALMELGGLIRTPSTSRSVFVCPVVTKVLRSGVSDRAGGKAADSGRRR